jgi:serine/threonine-protein kinase
VTVLEVVADTLETGGVVAGAYRLERELGRGGMGVVWSAREIASGRAVALKFLLGGAEADAKDRERFLREARAAMSVVHPNVARVGAVLETDVGTPFLVMELLDGESLRAVLRKKRTLDPTACARLFLPIVDGVAAAHARGIVHRDLKPENVFVERTGEVRVLDFGIAKQLAPAGETNATSLTSTGALVGTPVYMAPEQLFAEPIDPRADVWALGVVLYECLAGKRPTEGDGIGPILKRITSEPLVPLARAAPAVPPTLARIVDRMLLRERADRATLAEVRAVLARIAAGEDDDEPPRTVPMPGEPTIADRGPSLTRPTPAPTTPLAPPIRYGPPPAMPYGPPPAIPRGDVAGELDREMRARATQALLLSLLTLVACAPATILAVISAHRANAIAKQLGVRPPVRVYTATAIACVLGGLWIALMSVGAWIDKKERTDREARISELRAATSTSAANDALDTKTACGLAELAVLAKGTWDGGSGPFARFQCVGEVRTVAPGSAQLDGIHFERGNNPDAVTTSACFRRGDTGRWYVSDLGACAP